MKVFKKVTIVAALIGIMLTASACGKKDNGTGSGVGGGPGPGPYPYGAYVQQVGNGQLQVSFTASNIYGNGVVFSGGQVSTSNYGLGMYGQPKYCAYVGNYQTCYEFLNNMRQGGPGTLVPGGYNQGAGNMIQKQSAYFPGTVVTLALTGYGSDALHYNGTGTILLSQQVMQMIQSSPPAGWPNVTSVAIELYSSGGGGILLYTQGGHGVFIPM